MSTTAFHVLIPARLASSRLPRKLLAPVAGKPALYHSWKAAVNSGAAHVVIAADGPEIAAAAQGFGAEVCLTDPHLPSGTDRCLAACRQRNLADSEVIVNLQADELLMPPEQIAAVAELLIRSQADIATLAQPLQPSEADLPQRVKLVCNSRGRALYFSRAPIPWDVKNRAVAETALHHLGLYAYSGASLRRFAELPPSPLEQLEQLEQLRALEAGMSIAVGQVSEAVPAGLDTAEDLARICAVFALSAQKNG